MSEGRLRRMRGTAMRQRRPAPSTRDRRRRPLPAKHGHAARPQATREYQSDTSSKQRPRSSISPRSGAGSPRPPPVLIDNRSLHISYGASRLRLWWLSVPMRVVSSCRPREVVLAMLPFALVEGPLRARCMMVNLSPGCGRCNLSAVLVGTSSRRSRPRVGISHILRSPPAARSPRSSGAACYAASAERAWRNGS